MSKAEKFIQDYTRNCSNEFEPQKAPPSVYNPWLTPDQARRAVEIAREEMIAEVCEKYPQRSILVVPARGGGYYADSHLREGFINGYHQAEKDLELTWKDVNLLRSILFDVEHEGFTNFPYEEFCKEVLKRFKEKRGEKI